MKIIKKYLNDGSFEEADFSQKKETLEMEKIYSDDCLKKLFPNFDFYSK
jgi:hypothetical protein